MRRLTQILLAALVSLPALASAQWSGVYASGGQLTVRVAEDGARWSPEIARRYGTLLLRAEALLPHDVEVEVDFGEAEICEGPDHCVLIDGVTPDNLLSKLAEALSLPAEAVEGARSIDADVFVARIVPAPGEAEALLKRINTAKAYLHGNLEVGRFPGLNAQAVATADGEIWVGTFIDPVEAEMAVKALAGLGIHAAVHTLPAAR